MRPPTLLLPALLLVLVGCGGTASVLEPPPGAAPAAPDGFERVPGDWLLGGLSDDRRTAEIHVVGGGCTEFGGADLADAPEGLRLTAYVTRPGPASGVACTADIGAPSFPVALPRALEPDEVLVGGCGPDPAADPEGSSCSVLRELSSGPGGAPDDVVPLPAPCPQVVDPETGTAQHSCAVPGPAVPPDPSGGGISAPEPCPPGTLPSEDTSRYGCHPDPGPDAPVSSPPR